jgi:hypothetical protein
VQLKEATDFGRLFFCVRVFDQLYKLVGFGVKRAIALMLTKGLRPEKRACATGLRGSS